MIATKGQSPLGMTIGTCSFTRHCTQEDPKLMFQLQPVTSLSASTLPHPPVLNQPYSLCLLDK